MGGERKGRGEGEGSKGEGGRGEGGEKEERGGRGEVGERERGEGRSRGERERRSRGEREGRRGEGGEREGIGRGEEWERRGEGRNWEGRKKGERRGKGEQNCSKIYSKAHHFLTNFSGACPETPLAKHHFSKINLIPRLPPPPEIKILDTLLLISLHQIPNNKVSSTYKRFVSQECINMLFSLYSKFIFWNSNNYQDSGVVENTKKLEPLIIIDVRTDWNCNINWGSNMI